jgi:hypothetical protein
VRSTLSESLFGFGGLGGGGLITKPDTMSGLVNLNILFLAFIYHLIHNYTMSAVITFGSNRVDII